MIKEQRHIADEERGVAPFEHRRQIWTDRLEGRADVPRVGAEHAGQCD
jgi:hypothetical protein